MRGPSERTERWSVTTHLPSFRVVSIAFAPAIEYNWSSRIGTLLGVRIIEIGRNATASLTPAVALNMVF